MRSKRFQKGSLKIRNGRYIGQWYEGRIRRNRVLGRVSQMTKSEAEAGLAEILRPINNGTLSPAPTVWQFRTYVEKEFLPSRDWKEDSTRRTSEQIIKRHLLPIFGDRRIVDIDRRELSAELKRLAVTHSRSVVGHVCWFFKSIFALALSDGVVNCNPAAALTIPRGCRRGERRVLTPEQADIYLNALETREKLVASLALIEGMRPGEILALRRSSVRDGMLFVNERVYRGSFGTPKNSRSREVELSEETFELLQRWLECLGSDAREAFIFPSENPDRPISRDNIWRRNMYPRPNVVGLGWATFQVLRRSNASIGHANGVDPKAAADQRGHGLGVSMEVYTKSDRKQRRAVVKAIGSAVARRR